MFQLWDHIKFDYILPQNPNVTNTLGKCLWKLNSYQVLYDLSCQFKEYILDKKDSTRIKTKAFRDLPSIRFTIQLHIFRREWRTSATKSYGINTWRSSFRSHEFLNGDSDHSAKCVFRNCLQQKEVWRNTQINLMMIPKWNLLINFKSNLSKNQYIIQDPFVATWCF